MDGQNRTFKTNKKALVQRIISPFKHFTQRGASSSITLLSSIALALLLVNSPIGNAYLELWNIKLLIQIGLHKFSISLLHLVNDGLMAIFFLLLGLEIKREVLVGELIEKKRVLLPILSSIGGMCASALIFLTLNPPGSIGAQGWAIPIATDVAIALGVFSLIDRHISTSLKLLLTTRAIFDDLTAVIIIGIFYTSQIYWFPLLVGVSFLLLLVTFNVLGIRNGFAYMVPGVGVWFAFFNAGINPTLAGVLVAMTVPATTRIDIAEFCELSQETIQKLSDVEPNEIELPTYERYHSIVETLKDACTQVQAPLRTIEKKLTPWVVYGIVSIFALANIGVSIVNVKNLLTNNIVVGTILGLVIGKPVGITLVSMLAVKSGITELPSEVTWLHMLGVSFLGGIAFTLPIFIATLTFGSSFLLTAIKIGTLIASGISSILGIATLRYAANK